MGRVRNYTVLKKFAIIFDWVVNIRKQLIKRGNSHFTDYERKLRNKKNKEGNFVWMAKKYVKKTIKTNPKYATIKANVS